jgi:uncharacterized protein
MSQERTSETVFWRRTDIAGLERLTLTETDDGFQAASTVLSVEGGGFRIDHQWTMSRDWHAVSVVVEKWSEKGFDRLALERTGRGWTVDGMSRPDLEDTEEPDLSVTPFCNSFPIQRLIRENRDSLSLETCYIDASSMTVTRSRQRYDRRRAGLFRYVDLGLFAGFEADLEVDDRGMVIRYQKLFERVAS